MTIEPEFYLIALAVLTLTAAVRFRHDGFGPGGLWQALAALTTVKSKFDMRHSNKRYPKAPTAPVLLVVPASAQVGAAEPQVPAKPQPVAGLIRRDGAAQLDRISQIVNSAIETADRAKRLHVAAHEQVDSAHYALQNLLDELSAVMSTGPFAKSTRNATVTPMTRPATSHAAFTALAA